MESHVSRPDPKAPLGRRILGSLLSAIFGWLTLVLLWVSLAVNTPIYGAAHSAYFIFALWAVALLPLYLFVPRSSFLWSWSICTWYGAAVGALIIIAFASRETFLIAFAAIVGGTTCLFGSLTANRFRQNHAGQPA